MITNTTEFPKNWRGHGKRSSYNIFKYFSIAQLLITEHYLYPSSVGSWTPGEWYRQIISSVKEEYNYQLYITSDTQWENIYETLKHSIINDKDI